MKINNEEKWNQFKNSNSEYDGVYYIGVKSTGIFCRPSCKARKPLRTNVDFYNTKDECIQEGFRPCKRCRPDLLKYNPEEEKVEALKKIIETTFDKSELYKESIQSFEWSKNHQSAAFQKRYEMTLSEYRDHLRIEKAKNLLLTSTLPVIDIVFNSGFDSLSSFYYTFKKKVGITPKKYRAIKELHGN